MISSGGYWIKRLQHKENHKATGEKQMKTTTKIVYVAIVLLTLGCFALLPSMQAVSPPPDGGYPGASHVSGNHLHENQAAPDLTKFVRIG
jgi:hypothetical protein